MKEIALADIKIDDLQTRAATDEATVKEYAESMKRGDGFPPVVVFHDGRGYHLADGFHRVLAYQRDGVTHLWAEVHKGGRDEAKWFGAGSNKEHGLKRSNADKRLAVTNALAIKPDLSDRVIADHCGVHHDLVGKVRKEVAETPVERKSNNDKVKQNVFGPPPRRIGADGVKRGVRAVPSQKATVVLKDAIGRTVPEELIEYWERGDEVQVHLRTLSTLRGMARRAMEESDPFWAGVSLSRVLAELGNARRDLAEAIPHAVCPTCNGKLRKTCRLCHKRGFVSKYQWERLVPEEVKTAVKRSIK